MDLSRLSRAMASRSADNDDSEQQISCGEFISVHLRHETDFQASPRQDDGGCQCRKMIMQIADENRVDSSTGCDCVLRQTHKVPILNQVNFSRLKDMHSRLQVSIFKKNGKNKISKSI